MIGVLDLGLGNVGSLCQCLARLDKDCARLTAPDFSGCSQLVFPGVGHFGKAAEMLDQGWRAALADWVASEKSLIGICLGFQLLFSESVEAPGAKGLGFFAGRCEHVPSRKVPHMGWNKITTHTEWLTDFDHSRMYFVHSYAPRNVNDTVLTATDGGQDFTVGVWRAGVGGVQFHPEKSSVDGQNILKKFLEGSPC